MCDCWKGANNVFAYGVLEVKWASVGYNYSLRKKSNSDTTLDIYSDLKFNKVTQKAY